MTTSSQDALNGIRELNLKYTYFRSLGTVSYGVIGTFFTLFLLDYLSFAEVGVLFGVGMAVQAVTDYPSGALNDYIGQRNVLMVAYTLFVASNIVMLFATTFEQFLLSIILFYMGASQESGALQAWYDNAYRSKAKEIDPGRTQYGAFMGTLNLATRILGAVMIIISGVIAQQYGRRSLFFIELALTAFYLISIPLLLERLPKRTNSQEKLSFFGILTGGIHFTVSSRATFAIIFGIAIAGGAVEGLWGSLILFPLYASYAKTDTMTAILRFITWGFGIIAGLVAIGLSKRIKRTRKWLIRIVIPSQIGTFFCVSMFYFLLPPSLGFDLSKFIGLALAFNMLSLFSNLQEILNTRFIIDFVPDETRNSIYSLVSTLVVFVGVPCSIIGGILITIHGLLAGMILVTVIQFIASIMIFAGLYWIKNKYDP